MDMMHIIYFFWPLQMFGKINVTQPPGPFISRYHWAGLIQNILPGKEQNQRAYCAKVPLEVSRAVGKNDYIGPFGRAPPLNLFTQSHLQQLVQKSP